MSVRLYRLRQQDLEEVVRPVGLLVIIRRFRFVEIGVGIMRPCAESLEVRRRHHADVKAEGVEHQSVVILMERDIVDVGEQADNPEGFPADFQAVANAQAHVVGVHPVDCDFSFRFRRSAGKEAGPVNGRITAKNPDRCICGTVSA